MKTRVQEAPDAINIHNANVGRAARRISELTTSFLKENLVQIRDQNPTLLCSHPGR